MKRARLRRLGLRPSSLWAPCCYWGCHSGFLGVAWGGSPEAAEHRGKPVQRGLSTSLSTPRPNEGEVKCTRLQS